MLLGLGLSSLAVLHPLPLTFPLIELNWTRWRNQRRTRKPCSHHLYLRHYKSPTAPLDMHHLTFGINSLLHSVNLIVFTVLLVHLILRISPHHSHHLLSHHLSLPRPFIPELKLISFANPFLHSHSYSFRTDFTYSIKGALVLCFSFFFWLPVLDKAEHSAFESTLNSPIVSHCLVGLHTLQHLSNKNCSADEQCYIQSLISATIAKFVPKSTAKSTPMLYWVNSLDSCNTEHNYQYLRPIRLML